MILKSKKRMCECGKRVKCNCKPTSTPTTKGGRNNYDDDPTFNFDPEAPTFDGMTLEENFENFGEAVLDTAENFIPLVAGLVARKKYKASPVGQARQENKLARIQARQEKRLSRIQGGQAVREAKQQKQIELATIKAPLEAQQQAQQVNQLQSQLQPEARAVAPSQVPQGAGDSQGPLYQTLPMGGEAPSQFPTGLTGMGAGSMDTLQTDENPELTKKLEEVIEGKKTPEAPKKKNNVLFIGIALAVVIGAVYFLRKKKIA
jgi:hypothetical protein